VCRNVPIPPMKCFLNPRIIGVLELLPKHIVHRGEINLLIRHPPLKHGAQRDIHLSFEISGPRIEGCDAPNHLYDRVTDRRWFDRVHVVNRSITPFFAPLFAYRMTFTRAEENIPICLWVQVSSCLQGWAKLAFKSSGPQKRPFVAVPSIISSS